MILDKYISTFVKNLHNFIALVLADDLVQHAVCRLYVRSACIVAKQYVIKMDDNIDR